MLWKIQAHPRPLELSLDQEKQHTDSQQMKKNIDYNFRAKSMPLISSQSELK